MSSRHVLSDCVDEAMAQAIYDKLEEATFAARIPPCNGTVAFGSTLCGCQQEPRSTLEDWGLIGIKLGHALPVIGGIDLHRESVRETMDAL